MLSEARVPVDPRIQGPCLTRSQETSTMLLAFVGLRSGTAMGTDVSLGEPWCNDGGDDKQVVGLGGNRLHLYLESRQSVGPR